MAKILVYTMIAVSSLRLLGEYAAARSVYRTLTAQQAIFGIFLKLHIFETSLFRRIVKAAHRYVGIAFPILGYLRASCLSFIHLDILTYDLAPATVNPYADIQR